MMFFGFGFTFFPQFIDGLSRHAPALPCLSAGVSDLERLSSAGAVILAFAYLLPMGYLAWSLVCGGGRRRNPWGATGLEWQTASPPPEENFRTPPVVEHGPYNYHPEHAGPPAMEREQHQPQGRQP